MAHARTLVAVGSLAAAACGGKLVSDLDPEPLPVPTTVPDPDPSPVHRPVTTVPPPVSTSYPSPPIATIVDPPPSPPAVVDAGPELQVPPTTAGTWQAQGFIYDHDSGGSCNGGDQFVMWNDRYQLWVGAQLCSPMQYKLYLGAGLGDTFHEIVDWAGSGEDHCELVNPSFTNPSEDDITAACPSCALGPINAYSGPYLVYARGWFGDPFQLEAWPGYNNYTPSWYECGVSIP